MVQKFKKWFIDLILMALAISGCTRSMPVNVASLQKALDAPAAAATSASSSSSGFSLLPAGLFSKYDAIAPGDYTEVIKVKAEKLEAAKERSYGVHVPPAYDPEVAHAVVILLHAAGSSGSEFASQSKFNELADGNTFIAVYPEAFGAEKKWNTDLYPTAGANDTAFVIAVLDAVEKTYHIDPNRVFIAGHYDGGILAYKLGGLIPARLAAIGAYGASYGYQHNATETIKLPAVTGPVSLIAINGNADEVVPYNPNDVLQSGNASFLSARETEEYWMSQMGCGGDPDESVRNDENVRMYTYTCNGGREAQFVRVWYSDHRWPGSFTFEEKKKAEDDISASVYIWDFFSTHPLPVTQ
jgi:polyhydroxybutyrate depolymerase